MTDNFTHNPDVNPKWKPLVAWRVYACAECGHERDIQTNHTGTCPASQCLGKCRDIIAPHTENEHVIWKPARPHRYVRDKYAPGHDVIVSSVPGYGSKGSGLRVTMGDGAVWFHPNDGSAPVREA